MTPANEIEKVSSEIHDIYIKEAKRQGDVRHKDNYEELPDNIKEFDRVLARWIIHERKKAVIEARLDEHTPECAWCESGNKCNRGQELERQLFELEGGRNDRP